MSDGSQRYNGLLLSLRGSTRLTTVNANYTLSHCYGSPEGGGASTTNVSAGYNIPANPGFDDGNCAADRLHNFSLTASVQSPRLDNPAMRAAFSDWRLVGGFRKTTGPWLTITTGTDIALNGQAGTQRANQLLDDPYADMSINPANGGMRFLNPAAFAQPAAGTLGTSARNSIRGMGTRSLDHVADAGDSGDRHAGHRGPRRRVQCVQLVPVGTAGDRPEQPRDVRPDHDGRRAARHAVRDQVPVLRTRPSRIRRQAATGSWTKSRQWETQRTLFRSAGATTCAPAKVNGVWPSNAAWLRAAL